MIFWSSFRPSIFLSYLIRGHVWIHSWFFIRSGFIFHLNGLILLFLSNEERKWATLILFQLLTPAVSDDLSPWSFFCNLCITNSPLSFFFFFKLIWVGGLSLTWHFLLDVSSHFKLNMLNTKTRYFLCQTGSFLGFPILVIGTTTGAVVPGRNLGVILDPPLSHFPHLLSSEPVLNTFYIAPDSPPLSISTATTCISLWPGSLK